MKQFLLLCVLAVAQAACVADGFDQAPPDESSADPDAGAPDPGAALAAGCVARTLYVRAGAPAAGATGAAANPFPTIQAGVDAATAGTTVIVKAGTYRNVNFGNSNSNGAAVSIARGGSAGCYLTIRTTEGALVEFDGSGGFVGQRDIQYVKIQGFRIVGPAAGISEATARQRRLDDPPTAKFTGHGITFWGPSHHISVINNTVSYTCGSGIRANKSDYVTFQGNEVFETTGCSPAATSAMVIAEATNIDNSDAIKIRIVANRIHDNRNEIPFYAPRGFPPGANPPFADYGTAEADYIIDGSGIILTRNSDFYLHGRYLIANNLAYRNGINGIVAQLADRVDIVHNTIANNGTVPLSNNRQRNSGLTLNNVNDAYVANNLVQISVSGDKAIRYFGPVSGVRAAGNLYAGGGSDLVGGATQQSTLGLVQVDDAFGLVATSPAVDAAAPIANTAISAAVAKDLTGFTRVDPDVGAVERR